MRSDPDVSLDADPNTGVAVYCSVYQSRYGGNAGWFSVGGTSFSAPAWAGIIADINESNTYIKNPASLYLLAGSTGYKNNGGSFIDIDSGGNGIYNAKTGYDSVTGLGSPDAANLLKQAAANADTLASVPDVTQNARR